MSADIRRLENNLTTLGMGIILFSAWSFVKFALNLLFFGVDLGEASQGSIRVFAITLLWVFALLHTLIFLWIGFSARAEGRGKHKRIIYLVMVGLIVFIDTIVICLEIVAVIMLTTSIGRGVITLFIDVTRMVFLIDLLRSSITLRVMKKNERSAA